MTVRTRVDWVRTQSMFVRGGGVYRFANKVEDDVRESARKRAGKRSGALRRSIASSRHTVPLGVTVKVQAYAEHALWVEEGTAGGGTGRIYPRHGIEPMALYSSKGPQGRRTGIPGRYAKYRHARMWSVRGQKPKHFLLHGLHDGMVQNGLS
jgi:hypothetical protein